MDDEERSLAILKKKLKSTCPAIQVQATFSDPTIALDYLSENEIDLLFLDIEMPGMDGFTFLKKLGLNQISFHVIFVTAYDEHALQAFRFNAIDYLLKPVDVEELTKAVNKIPQMGSDHEKSLKDLQIPQLLDFMNNKDKVPTRVPLVTLESIEFVDPDEILYCESDSNYTKVFLQDGSSRVVSKTLKNFSVLLAPFSFFRSHHSFVVNLRGVREFIRADHVIKLTNGKVIPVAKSRREEFLKALTAI